MINNSDNMANIIALIGLVISVVSLFIAGVALWLNKFSPAKILATNTHPFLWIHIFTPPSEKPHPKVVWFNHTPIIVIDASFINMGARPGRLCKLRMKLSNLSAEKVIFADLEIFDYNLKPKPGQSVADAALEADKIAWHPQIILPKERVDLGLFFKANFDTNIPKGRNIVEFQMKTQRSNRWEVIERWNFDVTEQVYEMLENHTGFVLPVDGGDHHDTNWDEP
jgi:hypothetical protein